jgi:hypothetical protein
VTVIPDGITPEVGWRSWTVIEGFLCSLNNQTVWTPKEALQAGCSRPPRYRYAAQRGGHIVPTGRQQVERDIGNGLRVRDWAYGYEMMGQDVRMLNDVPLPLMQLPDGWGYEVVEVPQEPPEEGCTCGIYALRGRSSLVSSPYANSADAIGAVSLWGKVIPGQDGFRAQYAYPLQLFTDLKLEDYGVPVAPFADFRRDIPVRLLRRGKK